MKKVPVNKIIPFSAVDGPGNRTAVFLQGCNFDCVYCHNPETRGLCTDCGACVKTCQTGALTLVKDRVAFDPKLCCGCDTCIHTCTGGCSPRICPMDAGEVFEAVKRQIPYIRGVTVSGGECTRYPEFLEELFALCRASGLGTLIDSNGTLDFERYPELLAQTDGVMLDVKAWSAADHLKVTGCGNEMVKKNLRFLAEAGKLYEVRTVIVPELFDCRETVRETAACAAAHCAKEQQARYKIIKYRPMGVREAYAHLRMPDQEFLGELAALAKENGLREVLTV